MNAKTLRLLLIMLVCGLFTAHAQYSGGSGTAEDPYQVSTLTDLKELSLAEADWESHFIMLNDIDATETNTWEDEVGSIVGYTPIGYSSNKCFSGVFDGKGFTIKNLFIDRPNSSYIGLFGYAGSYYVPAAVQNVVLENAQITGKQNVGLLAGYFYNGMVKNCHVEGAAIGEGTSGSSIGGLVGSSRAYFENCSVSGTVSGYNNVGGFVGYASSNNDYPFEFFRCNSSASVSASKPNSTYAGAFVGYLACSTNSCYATGEVTAEQYAGGFAGYFNAYNGSVQHCIAVGEVNGGSTGYHGGFIGYYGGGTITECYALGAVNTSATANVGAFIGAYPYTEKLEDNFYNSDNGTNETKTGITGISEASFNSETAFSNWDFIADWELGINTNVSEKTLPYPKGLLYDYYVSYNQTIESAGTISGDFGWRNDGDEITITASDAVAPYVFAGWYNGDTKISAEQVLVTTVSGDAVYTARYKAEYSGGEGTQDDPYQISTLNDLTLLVSTEEDFDKYFIVINDIDASETANWVDTDTNRKGFTPIGHDNAFFTGNFDGQNFTISNLYINRPADLYAGLFGRVDKATLININLSNHDLTALNRIGGLVGNANATIIENCSANGTVHGVSDIGGLVGYMANGTMVNCFSEGTVTGSDANTGGLIGYVSGGSIERSYSKAKVSGYNAAGGFVGVGGFTAKYCYAVGEVTGREHVGGFIGSGSGSSCQIFYCFASGSVSESDLTGSTDPYGYVGGFVGSFGSGAKINMSYSIGDVYGTTTNTGSFMGGQLNIYYKGTLEDCIYDKETSNQDDDAVEGVTALTTAQFADLENYPENWDQEWEIGLLEEFDDNERSYAKVLLGYDYQVFYEVENDLAGEAESDKGAGWFKDGDEITLTATTSLGYEFDGWYLNDEKVSEDAIYTFSASTFATYIAKHVGSDVTFSGGAGSPLNPYKISTLNDLILLGNRIEDFKLNDFIVVNDIDASASADLNNGLGFKSIGAKIGYSTVNFEGKLDGNGYEISNLVINNPDESQVGLFKTLSGEVVNLSLKNCTVVGNQEVGIVCGSLKGIISRCSISGGSVSGTQYVGGFLGRSYNWPTKSQILYSFVDDVTVSGSSSIGGLAGYMQGAILSSTAKATVTGTFNVGGLTGVAHGNYNDANYFIRNCIAESVVNGNSAVGGLVGYVTNYIFIEKSYAIANVTASDNGGDNDGNNAGGLVGDLYSGHILDCYAVGTVKALDKTGGLVGIARYNSTIKKSYAAATIDAPGNYCGGLIADISSSSTLISDTYFDTEISGYDNGFSSDASNLAVITPLTTAEMALEANFSTLDFTGVWNVNTNADIDDKTRPYLKWETSSNEVSVTVEPANVAKVYGQGWYNLDDQVSLTTNVIPGWKLSEWKNNTTQESVDENYLFTIEENKTYNLTAVFVEDFSANGEGTEDMPFEIETLDQLEELSNLPSFWNKHFILMNDIDASATSNWNVGDHDNDTQTAETAMGFAPIGDEETYGMRDQVAFSGSFNGQGFTISGLLINRPLEFYVGLFGNVKGASIQNLTLDNATITGAQNVGVLVGHSYKNADLNVDYKSFITQCQVKNSSVKGDSRLGGLIGIMHFMEVTNSSVDNIAIAGLLEGYNGGFVGDLTFNSTIDNCFSTGEVSGVGEFFGGFAGRSTAASLVENSYSTCKVTGSQDVGGFVGMMSTNSIIKNSYATGDVESDGANGRVGGFVGYFIYGYITDCFASGNVISADLLAGGFVGYADGGSYSLMEKCYATGDVKGRSYLGGFAGLYGSHISYSYSTGTVDGSYDGEDGHVDYDVQFGGFVGRTTYQSSVTNCFTLSDVKGYIFVGGFVGVNSGFVQNCYSAGSIAATGASPGAFAGYVEEIDQAIIVGSYYDKTLASNVSMAIGGGKTNGVEGVSTTDFAVESNLSELPFGSIWLMKTITELDDNMRPYLKWEEGGSKLSVEFSQPYAATGDGDGWYQPNDEVSLFVDNIQPGLAFSYWDIDGVSVSTDNPYNFTFDASEDVKYKAIFVEDNIIAQGDGSEESPYIINNFDELICLSHIPSIWDNYFELGADIEAASSITMNNNTGFYPIGVDYEHPFTGHFDGKGFSISNLFINRSSSTNGQGLFAHVGDAEGEVTILQNIELINATVGGANGVGTLVGDMYNTHVINCNAQGYVLGTQSYVGGLIGRTNSKSKVTSSSYRGSVYSPSATTQTAVGGLVGYVSNSSVERCYALTDSIVSGGEAVGGLVGYMHDVEKGNQTSETALYGIKQSFAVSNKVSSAADYLGGFVGANNGAYIKESYSVAVIDAKSSMALSVGGFIGVNTHGVIENSYYDNSKDGARFNGLGTQITAADFKNELIFPTWQFNVENGWKMAIGQGGEKRPCLMELPSYSIVFKAGDHGTITIEGENNPVTEIVDEVMHGIDSRMVSAIADVDYEFVRWEDESGAIWDLDNVSTYVPANMAKDMVLVAMFEGDEVSVRNHMGDFIKTYPNPASNILFIDGINANATLRLYNTAGNEVFAENNFNGVSLNISHLSPGVYVLLIQTQTGDYKLKVIKQ